MDRVIITRRRSIALTSMAEDTEQLCALVGIPIPIVQGHHDPNVRELKRIEGIAAVLPNVLAVVKRKSKGEIKATEEKAAKELEAAELKAAEATALEDQRFAGESDSAALDQAKREVIAAADGANLRENETVPEGDELDELAKRRVAETQERETVNRENEALLDEKRAILEALESEGAPLPSLDDLDALARERLAERSLDSQAASSSESTDDSIDTDDEGRIAPPRSPSEPTEV